MIDQNEAQVILAVVAALVTLGTLAIQGHYHALAVSKLASNGTGTAA